MLRIIRFYCRVKAEVWPNSFTELSLCAIIVYTMQDQSRFLTRIYRLKLALVGLGLAILGVLSSVFADWLDTNSLVGHLGIAIIRGLSDLFLVAGAIGVAIDLLTGRSKDDADVARTRTAVKELAPDFTDAVVRGFAAASHDLERVATLHYLMTSLPTHLACGSVTRISPAKSTLSSVTTPSVPQNAGAMLTFVYGSHLQLRGTQVILVWAYLPSL